MKKNLYIKTYGCQMNVYDSQRMADILSPFGYALTEEPEQADIAILNTCHIREKAEQKVHSDLGRLRSHKVASVANGRNMIIAVGGCVGQAEGEEIIRQAPYVDMVFGPQTYHRLPEMLANVMRNSDKKRGPGRGVVDTEFPTEVKFDFLPETTESRSSAYVSVQEGCDKFCTFCVVPYTRGAEYSRPVESIVKEVKHLVKLGAMEITLLGQNVNAYHGEAPASSHAASKVWGLSQLIHELAEIDGLERIRYTTSHPRDMGQDLIDAHGAVPKLMPFLHLPVQSGSDRILEAMNRKHSADDYLKVIERLRKSCPEIAFSSDFIVGFPGETDEDHKNTLKLINDVNYAQAYSFKYSIRPGTPAGLMDKQVPESVKSERLQELQELVNTQQLAFNKNTVGTTQKVLLDRTGKFEGQLIGRTAFMQSVYVLESKHLFGQMVDVKIESGYANSISGVIPSDKCLQLTA